MILRNLSGQEYKGVKHGYPISVFVPENDDGNGVPIYPTKKYTQIIDNINTIIDDYKDNGFVEEEGVYTLFVGSFCRLKAYDAFVDLGVDVTNLTDEEIIALHSEYQITVDICQD